MTALFPAGADRLLRLDVYNGAGFIEPEIAVLRECQRCKAWVADRDGHTAWHRSVDTDQTTRPA